MNVWTVSLDILILLSAAAVLGGLFERFRQSAILGYLLAGVLAGPHALDLMPDRAAIASIAELGVALLLFMIGLEFSWRRLKNMGATAIGGGAVQVTSTLAVTMGLLLVLGLGPAEAFIIGSMAALSSTAIVMRLLTDRTEVDSPHGRNALGILLFQDIAVVPLILMVTLLTEEGDASQLLLSMGKATGAAIGLGLGLYALLGYVIPALLGRKETAANRDLPVLIAMIVSVGCAWGSHALGLSPVLGAFVGGVILAESPFAVQVRSDVAPLKTLFVTLFFASIGMLTNPGFVWSNFFTIAGLVALAALLKLVITFASLRLFQAPMGHAAATGLCLAQIGEFSFVIAELGRNGGAIGAERFELIIAVIVGTLFLAPYMVAMAPRLGRFLVEASMDGDGAGQGHEGFSPHVIIIGFGPAGKSVAEALRDEEAPTVVVELNSNLVKIAEAMGLDTVVGDATKAEVLHHAGVEMACIVAITTPDPKVVTQTAAQIRRISPATFIIARARYSRFRGEIEKAGANLVVDEEVEVGSRVAKELRNIMWPSVYIPDDHRMFKK